jgi:Glycosyl transferase family group 2
VPGTGGIWRRTCIENIGGWNHRTTVEDMDLSLRCHLAGWKCMYVNDVTSWNEVRHNHCSCLCRCSLGADSIYSASSNSKPPGHFQFHSRR